jgi:hypothetical protein
MRSALTAEDPSVRQLSPSVAAVLDALCKVGSPDQPIADPRGRESLPLETFLLQMRNF